MLLAPPHNVPAQPDAAGLGDRERLREVGTADVAGSRDPGDAENLGDLADGDGVLGRHAEGP
jgi:hypothetical protein